MFQMVSSKHFFPISTCKQSKTDTNYFASKEVSVQIWIFQKIEGTSCEWIPFSLCTTQQSIPGCFGTTSELLCRDGVSAHCPRVSGEKPLHWVHFLPRSVYHQQEIVQWHNVQVHSCSTEVSAWTVPQNAKPVKGSQPGRKRLTFRLFCFPIDPLQLKNTARRFISVPCAKLLFGWFVSLCATDDLNSGSKILGKLQKQEQKNFSLPVHLI